MRVLITGAGGFIGHHLVGDQLQRGRTVTAVDIHTDALQPLSTHPRLSILTTDFTAADLHPDQLRGHDICFHLASAHLETNVDDDHFWRVNVTGTRDFVARCHRAGIGRFVHCSSVGVFGDIEEPPADETSACRPTIAYEKSKLAGEKAVLLYARDNAYALTVVRPAWVYGPGCPRTLKLFRTIAKGRFFFVGNGRTLRHPIYIDDMVAGFEQAAGHNSAAGEVFIMAGPRPVTLLELVHAIADATGVQRPRLKLPRPLVWPAVLFLELAGAALGREMPFSRRSLKFFTGNTAFTIDKASQQLGFCPQIDLEEGIKITHEWMKETQQL